MKLLLNKEELRAIIDSRVAIYKDGMDRTQNVDRKTHLEDKIFQLESLWAEINDKYE